MTERKLSTDSLSPTSAPTILYLGTPSLNQPNQKSTGNRAKYPGPLWSHLKMRLSGRLAQKRVVDSHKYQHGCDKFPGGSLEIKSGVGRSSGKPQWHNNWPSRQQTKPKEPGRKWCPSVITSFLRYSLNRTQRSSPIEDPGITL